jgi:hypothetical protein
MVAVVGLVTKWIQIMLHHHLFMQYYVTCVELHYNNSRYFPSSNELTFCDKEKFNIKIFCIRSIKEYCHM